MLPGMTIGTAIFVLGLLALFFFSPRLSLVCFASREEGIEYLLLHLGGNTSAVVACPDLHPIAKGFWLRPSAV
jgi:hypothetical protein